LYFIVLLIAQKHNGDDLS